MPVRYKVDFKGYMADCELNFQRLLTLCPGLDETLVVRIAIPGRDGREFVIRVLDRARYTTELEIHEGGQPAVPWLALPAMRVRLYHDARLAEVVGFDGVWRVRPRNPYPNRVMHQPDEKAQWNRFLAEWLSSVADSGYAVTRPFVTID